VVMVLKLLKNVLSHDPAPPRGEKGFTLIEIAAVLTLLIILTLASVQTLISMRGSFDRHNASKQFQFDLRRAQAATLAEGTRGVIDLTSASSTYTYGYDRLPYSQVSITADEDVFITNLPLGVTIQTDTPIIIDSRGFLIDDDGDPTTVSVEFFHNGSSYDTATIYTSGLIEYD